MPRIARINPQEGIFHILTRGNNRQVVFHDKQDFKFYEDILGELKAEQPFKLYHWCLMTNHIHLIIETNKKTELSKLMKKINLLYYHHYKRKYGYYGHFWQDRFRSLLIDKDIYLLACGRYIERNPVRAKMVASPGKYPHSSYRYYAYGKKDGLTDKDSYYNELGKNDKERQKEYRRSISEEEKHITSSTFNQLFLGAKEFINKMEKKFEVTNTRLRRGRPSKRK